jgi:hypothetical protein
MRKFFFSDRAWKWKFFLTTLSLLGLCFYAQKVAPEKELTFATCQAHPEVFNGAELVLSCWQIKEKFGDGFLKLISSNREEAVVKAPQLEKLKIGEYVSVAGFFRSQGYLEVKEYYWHKNRKFKVLFSLFPLFIIGGAFFKNFSRRDLFLLKKLKCQT